jgi:hypothetical protein
MLDAQVVRERVQMLLLLLLRVLMGTLRARMLV